VPAAEAAAAPTTRRRKGCAREQTVVAAAAALIAERGVDNVRIKDIAERAGMSVGHVSYYFPHKSRLLLRAIEFSERGFRDDLAERCTHVADPWQRLSLLIELAMAEGVRDPGWVLWLEVWACAGRDAELAHRQATLDADWRRLLATVLRSGVEQGDFADHDPDTLSLTLSALMDGLSVRVTLGDPSLTAGTAREIVLGLAKATLRPVDPP
jgi:AcrR family transcriptional regulator